MIIEDGKLATMIPLQLPHVSFIYRIVESIRFILQLPVLQYSLIDRFRFKFRFYCGVIVVKVLELSP